MHVIIPDNLNIYLSNISAIEEDIVEKHFQAERKGRYYVDVTQSTWDGVYRKYHRGKKKLARPFLGMLCQLCHDKGFPITIEDQRSPSPYPLMPIEAVDNTLLPGITLEDYQLSGIKKIYNAQVGIFDVPTGGGKTELIAGICKVANCPTVILAEQRVVVDQIVERLELRMVTEEVGMFMAGRMPTGQLIIVGTVQSLVSPTKQPPVPIMPDGLPRANAVAIFNTMKNGEEYQHARGTDIGKLEKKYVDKLKKYFSAVKAFKTRKKKSGLLHKLVGQCEMILIDECVHEDSYISTDCGLMRAIDVVKALKLGSRISARVSGKYYNIAGYNETHSDSCVVTTSRNRSLTTSLNHKFMVFDHINGVSEKYANDLSLGDLILSASFNLDRQCCDERWYSTGLFIGDGHFLSNKAIRFGITKDVDEWYAAALNMTQYWKGTLSYKINQRGDHNFVIHAPGFCDWLKSLGFGVGRKSGNMNPTFNVPSESAASSLLRGIFDAEGSSYSDHATVDMVDKPVIEFCQYLFSYLGISASIGISNRRTKKHHKTLWRVRINGENYEKFLSVINFGFARKKRIYKSKLPSNRELYIQPILNSWIKCGINSRTLKKHLGLYNSILSPNAAKNKIAISTLIIWQNKMRDLCSTNINSWHEAKRHFGISIKDVSKLNKISQMTAWRRIKCGVDLYSDVINQTKRSLTNSLHDIPIDYSLERVTDVSIVKNKQHLIDFKVDGIAQFEANGILVHNCDLATSKIYQNIFRYWFKGRRRYGFTGTASDDDRPVEQLIMKEHLGSVIHKISRKRLEEANRTIPFEYWMIAHGEDGCKNDKRMFDVAVNELMVYDESFHDLIINICNYIHTEDDTKGILILVERDDLGHALKSKIPGSEFIHGKTPAKQRPLILSAFEQRVSRVLIGGKNVKRGMDLSGGCEEMILATGGKLSSGLKQQIGRANRLNRLGKARIWDALFLNNEYLYDHSRKRLKTIISMSYPSFVMFKDGVHDGEQFVKSRYRRTKRSYISQSLF